jgi:urease accessory protein
MTLALTGPAVDPPSGWRGALSLSFVRGPEATYLRRRGQVGPLAVQRPFFPEGPEVCHVVLLHPPGGIVPGDVLDIDVDVETGAHVLLTTPAATKIYRSDGRVSSQTQRLRLHEGAVCEWLPQENICFVGARARLATRVELATDATFLGWDLLCLGRPAAGERAFAGICRQQIEVFRNGRPLLVERADYDRQVQAAPWGLRGASVVGTMLAVSPRLTEAVAQELLAQLRKLGPRDDGLCSASLLSGILVFRYVGNGAEPARILFEQAWHLLRPVLVGRPACAPRIWST